MTSSEVKRDIGRPRRERAVASTTVTIRLTPKERKLWLAAAHRDGQSLSDWVREWCSAAAEADAKATT